MVELLGHSEFCYFKLGDHNDCSQSNQEDFFIQNGAVVLRTAYRLGNQLFQYAAAYSLAKQTDSALYVFVDASNETDYNRISNWAIEQLKDPNTDKNYYLTHFNLSKNTNIIPINEHTINAYKALYPGEEWQCPSESIELGGQNLKIECINSQQKFKEAASKKNDRILVMAGFFENQFYFDKVSSEISEQYTLVNFDASRIQKTLEKVSAENSICMNIRRKDMLLVPKLYLPIDFQEQAIKFIERKELVENPKYFVVSDDIELAKEELKAHSNIEYIEGNTALEGLLILANCRNNIQTKSSYSWWATYLNNNPGFTISPCNYHSLYKQNSLTYKIFYTINNTKICSQKSFNFNKYIIQYKDKEGQNIDQFAKF